MLEITVNIASIRENLRYVRALIKPNTKLLFMVKADAYGHGMLPTAKGVSDLVDGFGVATAENGAELRRITNKPILVTAFTEEGCQIAAEYKLTPLLSSAKEAYALEKYVHKLPYSLPVHIKINTGMNRLGVSTASELSHIVGLILNSGKLRLQGMATHYYSNDKRVLEEQTKKFLELVTPYKRQDKKLILHASASGAAEADPSLNFDMVRIGLLGYGYSSKNPYLKPALTVKSKLLQINNLVKGDTCGYSGLFVAEKNAKIGIISGGYYDGVPVNRKSAVYINGKTAPIIGRTMMDLTAVLLDDIDANTGDAVYFLCDRFGANKIAEMEGTVPYEILTRYRVRTNRKKTYEQTGIERGD